LENNHEGPAASGSANSPIRRPARALIGWLPEIQGEMLLSGTINSGPAAQVPENLERARQARDAVAARTAGIDQAELTLNPPPELDDHIAKLRESPGGASMFLEGWQVAIVDLSRVCGFQPVVFTDTTAERVDGIKADDMLGIAAITLPTEQAELPKIGFDMAKQVFTVLSPNPNLRIVGNFMSEAPEAQATGIGFLVRILPSFVKVVVFQGRYILTDGYHRAHGLLGRGINMAPVFVKTANAIEEVALPGMLPQGAYLGDRPPLLTDYHHDVVASPVQLPAAQKMIVVQGFELGFGG